MARTVGENRDRLAGSVSNKSAVNYQVAQLLSRLSASQNAGLALRVGPLLAWQLRVDLVQFFTTRVVEG